MSQKAELDGYKPQGQSREGSGQVITIGRGDEEGMETRIVFGYYFAIDYFVQEIVVC